MGNFNPKLPTKHVGTNKYITFFVSRNRIPTLADYRQPETGTLYSVGTVWQVSKDPTTGSEGDIYMLSKIVSNQGYWVLLSSGSSNVDSVQVDALVSPGTNPVLATSGGLLIFHGTSVVAGSFPVRTISRALNTYALEVQISQAIASTDATKVGLSAFSSSHFAVDANGFVTLAGGGIAIDSIAMQTGSSPIVGTSAGLITFNGAVVAAGTNPVRTDGTGVNTMALEIQISQAIAATDATKIGLSNFNSSDFTVDANGFVSLVSSVFKSIVVQTFSANGTYTPTSGMTFCTIELVGGGGGGGSSSNTAANEVSVGGGGGGGGYARKTFSAGTVGVSQVVTIGSGGLTAGGNGGTTSVGALLSATGGFGGGSGGASTSSTGNGSPGGIGSNGDINVRGGAGICGIGANSGAFSFAAGGSGGSSYLGGGGAGAAAASGQGDGSVGGNYGGGGAGAICGVSGTASNGGVGGPGFVIITEYI